MGESPVGPMTCDDTTTLLPPLLSHLEIDVLREADLLVKEGGAADGREGATLLGQASDDTGRALRNGGEGGG